MLKFTVLKTRLEVSPLFFAVLTLFLLSDQNKIAIPALIFSLFHECGHVAALLVRRSAPQKIRISAVGIQIELAPNLSAADKIIILSAGFTVNFCLATLFFTVGEKLFAFVNLTIGIFTALPMASTDGGSIIKEIISEHFLENSERFEKRFFTCSGAAFALLLICLMAATGNFYLLIALFYLAVCTIKE